MAGSLEQRAATARRAAQAFDRAVAGPPPIRVTISDDDTGGTRGFDRVFAQLGATLDAMPDILRRDALPAIRAEFAQNFAREGGRTGWAPLKQSTQRERRRLRYPPAHPILYRTGALRAHVLETPGQITRSGSGVTLRIAPARSVDGVPKYRALAKGRPGMPGRPMVVLRPDASARVAGVMSRAMRARAAANGLR